MSRAERSTTLASASLPLGDERLHVARPGASNTAWSTSNSSSTRSTMRSISASVAPPRVRLVHADRRFARAGRAGGAPDATSTRRSSVEQRDLERGDLQAPEVRLRRGGNVRVVEDEVEQHRDEVDGDRRRRCRATRRPASSRMRRAPRSPARPGASPVFDSRCRRVSSFTNDGGTRARAPAGADVASRSASAAKSSRGGTRRGCDGRWSASPARVAARRPRASTARWRRGAAGAVAPHLGQDAARDEVRVEVVVDALQLRARRGARAGAAASCAP